MKSHASKQGIIKCLNSPFDVEFFDTLASTNLTAKEMIRQGKAPDFVVVARQQTNGRGRFERKFFSPEDCGAYFSAVVAPKKNQIPFFTPLCAIAAANAVREICRKDAKIKWVNDVYVGTKKCVGILCEAVASVENGNIDRIVAGIGIDLFVPEGGFDESIKDKVCAVGEGIEDVCNRIVAKTLDNIRDMLDDFDEKRIAKTYGEMSLLIGKNVVVSKVEMPDREAKVVDIDDECRLVVAYPDGSEEHLFGGEVSVKW